MAAGLVAGEEVSVVSETLTVREENSGVYFLACVRGPLRSNCVASCRSTGSRVGNAGNVGGVARMSQAGTDSWREGNSRK